MSSSLQIVARSAKEKTEAGNWSAALRAINYLMQRDPDNAVLFQQKADLFRASGDPEMAVELYEKAHGLDPDNREIAIGYAVCVANNGDPERAIAILDAKAGTNCFWELECQMTAGKIFLSNQRFDRAEERFRGIIDRFPDNHHPVACLARTLVVQEKWEDAVHEIEAFRRREDRDASDDTELFHPEAIALANIQGREQDALRAIEKAVKVLHAGPQIHASAAILLGCKAFVLFKMNEIDAAIEEASASIVIDETFAPARILLSGIHASRGDVDLALACCDDGIENVEIERITFANSNRSKHALLRSHRDRIVRTYIQNDPVEGKGTPRLTLAPFLL